MRFIKREMMPQEIKIAGNKYPAIYNFGAIAIMEEHTGTSHIYSLARLTARQPSARDFIGCLAGMLAAAGVEEEQETPITAETLIKTIRIDEEAEILEQMLRIIVEQSPEPNPSSKNVKTLKAQTGTN